MKNIWMLAPVMAVSTGSAAAHSGVAAHGSIGGIVALLVLLVGVTCFGAMHRRNQ